MPQPIQDFLTDLADAFRRCDMAKAVKPFATPATIAIAGQTLYVQDLTQAIAILNTYHDNLRVEGYANTLVTVHHEHERKDGQVRALVTWTQVNRSGAKISALDISYLLEPTDTDQGWRIVLTEMINEPIPRLSAGIPIH